MPTEIPKNNDVINNVKKDSLTGGTIKIKEMIDTCHNQNVDISDTCSFDQKTDTLTIKDGNNIINCKDTGDSIIFEIKDTVGNIDTLNYHKDTGETFRKENGKDTLAINQDTLNIISDTINKTIGTIKDTLNNNSNEKINSVQKKAETQSEKDKKDAQSLLDTIYE